MVNPIIGRGPDVPNRVAVGTPETRPAAKAAEASSAGAQATVRTPADAINIMRTRLEQRVQQAMGGPAKPAGASEQYAAQAQPPTASDVANTILGFVQNRLQQEADAGADVERLTELMQQARAGIEQGYAEAREQIEALGMMNETLSADIDDGFNLIQDGLLEFERLFLGQEQEPQSKPE